MDNQYCRFCGNNKGHATSACKNIEAMREALVSTERELQAEIQRSCHAEEQLKKLESVRDQANANARVLFALVSLIEKEDSRG